VNERAPEPGDVFSFASRRARVYALLFPMLTVGVVILIGVAAPNPWRFLALPGLIGAAFIVWRAARITVELRYEGVVVRNTYRTYEFRWGDVRSIYLGGGVGMGDCIAFVLKDARLGIEADATSDAWRDEELVRQLCRHAGPHGVQIAPELLEHQPGELGVS
jgi:hypothetical protein